MQEFKKLIGKGRVVLLPLLLSAPLLACATTNEPTGAQIVYRYPPASLLVLDPDPTKPTLEQLQGPEGGNYAAKYVLDLELSGMTRGQALRCLSEWKNRQMALDAGTTPESDPPPYCVFAEEK